MKVMSEQIIAGEEINIINNEEGIAKILTDVLLIDSFDDSFWF